MSLPLQTTDTPKVLVRFLKYNFIGIATFLFDLLLISFFARTLGFPDLLAVAVAFVIAATINYSINRCWAFHKTMREIVAGYAYFFMIVSVALVLTLIGTYLLTTYTELSLLLSRIVVATAIGLGNFLAQSLITFRLF